MPEPIIVGVDGSRAALAAVLWAADDAARRGCDLRIVHVVARSSTAGSRMSAR